MAKKDIAFVTVGDDLTPSTRHRILVYRPFLDRENISWSVHLRTPSRTRVAQFPPISLARKAYFLLTTLLVAPRHRAVYLQKVIPPLFYTRVLLLLIKNLIFDFDDALYEELAHDRAFMKRFTFLLTRAKLVLTGSLKQREYAALYNPHCEMLPPVMSREEFPEIVGKEKRQETVTIGWIGGAGSLKYLQVIRKVLRDLFAEHSYLKLRIISSKNADFPELGDRVEFCRWSLQDYIKDMRKFDIAVSPLTADEYSHAKGGRVSVLNSLGLGIPVVISPGGGLEYHIQDDVNGFLAVSPADWHDKINRLIKDPQTRKRIGIAGFKLANQKFFSDCTFPKFHKLISSVIHAE
jgi:glycosyltransferase involved in cell wall biosynthesis